MKRPYQVTAFALLILSAYVFGESLQLSYFTPLGPGPGFFPLWLAVLLAILALVMGYQATFASADQTPKSSIGSLRGRLRVGAIVLALAWTILGMDRLGFNLTMLVFFSFLLFALGRQCLVATIGIALAGSFGINYVLEELLSIPLPNGLLSF